MGWPRTWWLSHILEDTEEREKSGQEIEKKRLKKKYFLKEYLHGSGDLICISKLFKIFWICLSSLCFPSISSVTEIIIQNLYPSLRWKYWPSAEKKTTEYCFQTTADNDSAHGSFISLAYDGCRQNCWHFRGTWCIYRQSPWGLSGQKTHISMNIHPPFSLQHWIQGQHAFPKCLWHCPYPHNAKTQQ
jgi:hypothetical protein